MNVLVHLRLVAVLRGCVLVVSGSALAVGADLGDGVEVAGGRAGEPVGQAAVADQSGSVVDTGTALDEAVRTRRVGEQRARVADTFVIARISLVVCPATTWPRYGMVYYGLTSHSTHYRSFRRRVYDHDVKNVSYALVSTNQ